MAKYTKELMAELLAARVKTISFDGEAVTSVEFFEQKAPGFGMLDLDTIVPPADPHAPEGDGERIPDMKVPPALKRLLEKGSVS